MRKHKLENIFGQENIKQVVSISLKASIEKDEPFPHTVLYGPAGLGKTTIANAIANEMGTQMKVVLGGNISGIKDLLPTITTMSSGSILFIDEIHNLKKRDCEFLYSIMEDNMAHVPLDKGNKQKEIVSVGVSPFTLIGATTEIGSLPTPLIDRFVLRLELSRYSEEEMCVLVEDYSKELGVSLCDDSIIYVSMISRGVPRLAKAHVNWLNDFRIAQKMNKLFKANVESAMSLKGIDINGFTDQDRRYISLLKRINKPVGVSTICASLNLDKDTVENVIEPWLLNQGMIIKTAKGRQIV